MKARERGAAQERRIAAENEADEILEDWLLDRVAVKFQGDALEPIDVGKRDRYRAGLVIGMKRN